jgi:hypothetical protein
VVAFQTPNAPRCRSSTGDEPGDVPDRRVARVGQGRRVVQDAPGVGAERAADGAYGQGAPRALSSAPGGPGSRGPAPRGPTPAEGVSSSPSTHPAGAQAITALHSPSPLSLAIRQARVGQLPAGCQETPPSRVSQVLPVPGGLRQTTPPAGAQRVALPGAGRGRDGAPSASSTQ